jgi:hypothetical protein
MLSSSFLILRPAVVLPVFQRPRACFYFRLCFDCRDLSELSRLQAVFMPYLEYFIILVKVRPGSTETVFYSVFLKAKDRLQPFFIKQLLKEAGLGHATYKSLSGAKPVKILVRRYPFKVVGVLPYPYGSLKGTVSPNF